MARININVGSAPNDGTGDSLGDAFVKVNTNFVELYDNDAADTLDAITTLGNTTTNSITVGGLIVDTDTLYVDSTNNRVGIGNTSPTAKFQIGDGNSSVFQTIDSSNGGSINFKKSGTSSAFIGEVQQGLGTGDGLLLYTYSGADRPIRFYTNNTERMRIHSDGDISFRDLSTNEAFYWDASAAYLGIGTDSPDVKLHSFGTGDVAKFETTSYGGVNFSRENAVGNNSSHFVNSFNNADSEVAYIKTFNRTGATTSTGTGYELQFAAAGSGYQTFYTNSTERMRITSGGDISFRDTSNNEAFYWDASAVRLGIGTDSPVRNISVYGSSSALMSFHNSTTGSTISDGMFIGNDASAAYLYNYEATPLNFGTSGTQRMRIHSGGDISFRDTSTNEAFYWDASAASLGIGTDSPRSILETNGTISINDSRSSLTTGDTLAGLDIYTGEFSYNPPSGRLSMPVNRILPVCEQVEGDAFGMAFYTAAKDADSVEQMRIDSNGNVGIGISSGLTYPLTIQGETGVNNSYVHFVNATTGSAFTDGTQIGIPDGQSYFLINQREASDIRINTAATERMRIHSGGDVSFRDTSNNEAFYWDASTASLGIGKTPSTEKLEVNGAIVWEGALTTSQTSAGVLDRAGDDLRIRAYGATAGSGALAFRTGGGGGSVDSEAMRITSGGQVLFSGLTSTEGGVASNGIEASCNQASSFTAAFNQKNTSAYATLGISATNSGGTNKLIWFYVNDYSGGGVGSISTNGTSTAYNTTSDYRLKENVVDMTGALDRVDQLEPKRFNFIADANNTVDGFLAHEVAEIVPEAISGEKDAEDDEGNPVYQGIDQSKLVPLLVGAIQELRAEIETLKAQINA